MKRPLWRMPPRRNPLRRTPRRRMFRRRRHHRGSLFGGYLVGGRLCGGSISGVCINGARLRRSASRGGLSFCPSTNSSSSSLPPSSRGFQLQNAGFFFLTTTATLIHPRSHQNPRGWPVGWRRILIIIPSSPLRRTTRSDPGGDAATPPRSRVVALLPRHSSPQELWRAIHNNLS